LLLQDLGCVVSYVIALCVEKCDWLQAVGAVIGSGGENIRRLRSEVCFVTGYHTVSIFSFVIFT